MPPKGIEARHSELYTATQPWLINSIIILFIIKLKLSTLLVIIHNLKNRIGSVVHYIHFIYYYVIIL